MNEDNVLIRSNEPAADPQPASGLYPLDWETTEVKLFKGKFSHVLRRPTAEQLLKRDQGLQQKIPVGRDGSYTLPDPTATEAVDAALFDEICVESRGYTDEIPQLHKSQAFNGLYQRELSIEDDADLFAEEIEVIEEIGSGIDPDFVIRHVFRQPTQSELNSYRRKANASSEIKPGKRGRQIVATRSSIKSLTAFYDLWVVRIEGASVGGREWSEDARSEFLATMDLLVKQRAVSKIVEKLTDSLSD